MLVQLYYHVILSCLLAFLLDCWLAGLLAFLVQMDEVRTIESNSSWRASNDYWLASELQIGYKFKDVLIHVWKPVNNFSFHWDWKFQQHWHFISWFEWLAKLTSFLIKERLFSVVTCPYTLSIILDSISSTVFSVLCHWCFLSYNRMLKQVQ